MITVNELCNIITPEMEAKYFKRFSKRAQYLGNGIYNIDCVYSKDTRELFLMYCAICENIEFENI